MPRYLATEALIKDILGDDYLDLRVTSISISEHVPLFPGERDEEGAQCELKVGLTQQNQLEKNTEMFSGRSLRDSENDQKADLIDLKKRELMLSGSGVGFVDAGYEALMDYYGKEYPSLKTLSFQSFDTKAALETSRKAGADAECKIRLVVHNDGGFPFEFEANGRSMAVVSLTVVMLAVEYFVNSERAFICVYRALSDAKDRGRQDLVESFTAQLSELVKTTSYTEVIAQIKEEVLSK